MLYVHIPVCLCRDSSQLQPLSKQVHYAFKWSSILVLMGYGTSTLCQVRRELYSTPELIEQLAVNNHFFSQEILNTMNEGKILILKLIIDLDTSFDTTYKIIYYFCCQFLHRGLLCQFKHWRTISMAGTRPHCGQHCSKQKCTPMDHRLWSSSFLLFQCWPHWL